MMYKSGKKYLIEALKENGFSAAKINSNMSLIEAVLTALSDDSVKNEINLAHEKLIQAGSEKQEAIRKLNEAAAKEFKAEMMLNEVKNRQEQIEKTRAEIEAMQEELTKALECETAEARDKARLFIMFKQECYDPDALRQEKAYIYGAGAILAGGSPFNSGNDKNDSLNKENKKSRTRL